MHHLILLFLSSVCLLLTNASRADNEKTFIILYSLVVISIIIIGWDLDKIWENQFPDGHANDHRIQIINLLGFNLSKSNLAENTKPTDEIQSLTPYFNKYHSFI